MKKGKLLFRIMAVVITACISISSLSVAASALPETEDAGIEVVSEISADGQDEIETGSDISDAQAVETDGDGGVQESDDENIEEQPDGLPEDDTVPGETDKQPTSESDPASQVQDAENSEEPIPLDEIPKEPERKRDAVQIATAATTGIMGDFGGFVSDARLTYVNGGEIQDGDEIKLSVRFNLSLELNALHKSDLDAIRESGILAYAVDIPNELAVVTNEGEHPLYILVDNHQLLLGNLIVDKGTVRFEFATGEGTFLPDSGAEDVYLHDIWIVLECGLDESDVNIGDSPEIIFDFAGFKKVYHIIIVPDLSVTPTIEKTGSYNKSEGRFDWKVVISKGGFPVLENLLFEDVLGSSQELIAGTFMVNGHPIEANISGDTFTASLDGPYNDDIVVTYSTRLKIDALFTNGEANTGEKAITVENKSKIAWTAHGGGSAEDGCKIENISISFLHKEGRRIGETDTLEWEITVNTFGQSFEYLYLFDEMGADMAYVTGSMKVNGSPLTPEQEEGRTITDSNGDIMRLILTKESQNDLYSSAGSILKITYRTAIDPQSFVGGEKEYSNNAWLEFAWPSGTGPAVTYMTPEVSKTIKAGLVPLTKRWIAAGTSKSERIITWEITVNASSPVDIEKAVLTDTPRPNTDKHPNGTNYNTHVYLGYVEGSFTLDGNKQEGAALDAIFSYDNYTRTISLTDIGKRKASFLVQTETTDPIFLSGNQWGLFENVVDMDATIFMSDGSSAEISGSAASLYNPKSNALSKRPGTYSQASGQYAAYVPGDYDYSSRSIEWTITVNEDKVNPLDGVVITDTLSDGQELVGSTNDVVVREAGTNTPVTLAGEIAYNPDTHLLTIPLGSIGGKTIEIIYTTRLADTFDFGAEDTFTITNTAKMKSDYNSYPEAKASISVPNTILEKSAEYERSGQDIFVAYAVFINQSQKPFPDGVVLRDTMNGMFQLDLSSVKLYSAEILPDGEFRKLAGGEIPLTDDAVSYSYSGTEDAPTSVLKVAIPEGTRACILEYMVIASSYSGSSLINTIEFKSGGSAPKDSGKHELDFGSAPQLNGNAAKYGTAEIIKIDALTKEPLAGAIFALYQYTGDSPPPNDISKMDTDKLKFMAAAETDMEGKAVLKTIIPAISLENRYFIKETTAPDGYVLSDTNYLVKLDDGKYFLTVENSRNIYPFTISKASLVDGVKAALPGAWFALRAENSEMVLQTAVSGDNGLVTFSGLPSGRYVVTEKQAPEGYLKSEALLSVEIDGDGEITFSSTGANGGSIEISSDAKSAVVINMQAVDEPPETDKNTDEGSDKDDESLDKDTDSGTNTDESNGPDTGSGHGNGGSGNTVGNTSGGNSDREHNGGLDSGSGRTNTRSFPKEPVDSKKQPSNSDTAESLENRIATYNPQTGDDSIPIPILLSVMASSFTIIIFAVYFRKNE